MSGRLRASPDDLLWEALRYAAWEQTVKAQVTALDKQVAWLRDHWQGQGAEAFYTTWEQKRQQLLAFAELLRVARRALDGMSEQYVAASDASIRILAGPA